MNLLTVLPLLSTAALGAPPAASTDGASLVLIVANNRSAQKKDPDRASAPSLSLAPVPGGGMVALSGRF